MYIYIYIYIYICIYIYIYIYIELYTKYRTLNLYPRKKYSPRKLGLYIFLECKLQVLYFVYNSIRCTI